jgi:iron-sulfur cluster assembly protein
MLGLVMFSGATTPLSYHKSRAGGQTVARAAFGTSFGHGGNAAGICWGDFLIIPVVVRAGIIQTVAEGRALISAVTLTMTAAMHNAGRADFLLADPATLHSRCFNGPLDSLALEGAEASLGGGKIWWVAVSIMMVVRLYLTQNNWATLYTTALALYDGVKGGQLPMSLQIEVTPDAIAKLAELGTQKHDDYVRVSAEQSCGCGRIGYRMYWDHELSDEDEQLNAAGVILVVNSESRPYVEGGVLDYKTDPMEEGFVISNPQAQSGCSCGGH